MYGKVFASMYDGTLVDSWEALVTFQQMIVLADSGGIVDMTPQALSRRTGIPLEIITEGLRVLARPDLSSRTADMDGKRICLLDDHRDWGWFIVNYAKYRDLADAETRRRRDAERKRLQREKASQTHQNAPETSQNSVSADVPDTSGHVRTCPPASAMSAHIDTDVDIDTDVKKQPKKVVSGDPEPSPPAEARSEFSFAMQKGSYTLTVAEVQRYQATYAFDVPAELRKASLWLRDNKPSRPRSSTRIRAFVTRWLNRADDAGKGQAGPRASGRRKVPTFEEVMG
jgi:hypothetical protein